jgi:energy-coupling factor transport system substrate-specific component
MRVPTGVTIAGASVLGAGLFGWPFLGGKPGATGAAALAVGTVAAIAAIEIGARRLSTRDLALLAGLAALAAASRAVLVTGVGGFSPLFLFVLCGGYVFGVEYGFLLGATSLLVSALVTGGIGPWLPYQLFAVGWVGAAAGWAGTRRADAPTFRHVGVLAAVGVLAGYGFGAVMDIWNWTFYQSSPGLGFQPGMPAGTALAHFGNFYLLTSLGYDSFRAAGNAVMVVVLGLPILVALDRLRRRRTVQVVRLDELAPPAPTGVEPVLADVPATGAGPGPARS